MIDKSSLSFHIHAHETISGCYKSHLDTLAPDLWVQLQVTLTAQTKKRPVQLLTACDTKQLAKFCKSVPYWIVLE